jgi:glycosyltransferase involved in cell wall biosynthesis
MRTAIVYDWIDKWGGVERVLLALAKMFPRADWYTSYFDPKAAPWAKNLNPMISFIQKLPDFLKKNRVFSIPFYPYAFESFNFSNYDLVVSVSSSFAKAVITKPRTLHISYLLTPTRYFWQDTDIYLNGPLKKLGKFRLKKYQQWDFVAGQRPDHIISISKTVQERVKKIYNRDSEVIYPPFDIDYWRNIKPSEQLKKQKYFLVVSRLEPYKRVDLVVETFNQLNLPLIIVGKGTERRKLQKISNKNTIFVSDLSDEELAQLYLHAQALIMPQEEEFGYVSLEAQFFGCPVISYKKGGATETILDEKTGIFFGQQTANSLADAVARFPKIEYNLSKSTKEYGKQNIERFSLKTFENMFNQFIAEKLS